MSDYNYTPVSDVFSPTRASNVALLFSAEMQSLSVDRSLHTYIDKALLRFFKAKDENPRHRKRAGIAVLQGIFNELRKRGPFVGFNGSHVSLARAEEAGILFKTMGDHITVLNGISARLGPALSPDGRLDNQQHAALDRLLKLIVSLYQILGRHAGCGDKELFERLSTPDVLLFTLDLLAESRGQLSVCACLRMSVAAVDVCLVGEELLELARSYGITRSDDLTELIRKGKLTSAGVRYLVKGDCLVPFEMDALAELAQQGTAEPGRQSRRQRGRSNSKFLFGTVSDENRALRATHLKEVIEELYKKKLPIDPCPEHAPGKERVVLDTEKPTEDPVGFDAVHQKSEELNRIVTGVAETLASAPLKQLMAHGYFGKFSLLVQEQRWSESYDFLHESGQRIPELLREIDAALQQGAAAAAALREAEAMLSVATAKDEESQAQLAAARAEGVRLEVKNKRLARDLVEAEKRIDVIVDNVMRQFEHMHEDKTRLEAELTAATRELEKLRARPPEVITVPSALPAAGHDPVEPEAASEPVEPEPQPVPEAVEEDPRPVIFDGPDLTGIPAPTASELASLWNKVPSVPSTIFRAEYRSQLGTAAALLRADGGSKEAKAILRSVKKDLQELAA